MQTELLERAKVAKVLTAINNGSILKPKHLTEIQDITVDDAQVEEVEGNPECKHVSCSVLLSLFYFRSGLTLT